MRPEIREPVAGVVLADVVVMVDFEIGDPIQDGMSTSSGPGLGSNTRLSELG